MKKLSILSLSLAFVFGVVSCGNNAPTQLGTSDYTIVLPAGYTSVEEDFEEDQVAYYYKDDNSVDFDVYQWEKGTEYTLAEEAEHYATEYGSVAEPVTVNDINGYKYVTEEQYESVNYTVVNYMFEDDTYIVEICFWTVDTAEEYAVVDKIINTLEKK